MQYYMVRFYVQGDSSFYALAVVDKSEIDSAIELAQSLPPGAALYVGRIPVVSDVYSYGVSKVLFGLDERTAIPLTERHLQSISVDTYQDLYLKVEPTGHTLLFDIQAYRYVRSAEFVDLPPEQPISPPRRYLLVADLRKGSEDVCGRPVYVLAIPVDSLSFLRSPIPDQLIGKTIAIVAEQGIVSYPKRIYLNELGPMLNRQQAIRQGRVLDDDVWTGTVEVSPEEVTSAARAAVDVELQFTVERAQKIALQRIRTDNGLCIDDERLLKDIERQIEQEVGYALD